MDVGIVIVISLNALVIGISADNPGNAGLWEVLELVPQLHTADHR